MKIKIYNKLLFIVIISFIFVYLSSNYSPKLYRWITLLMVMIPLSFFTIKICLVYIKYFLNYMFCNPNDWWVREVQRPRLLFHLLVLPFLFLFTDETLKLHNSFYNGKVLSILFYLFATISLTSSISGVILLNLCWKNKFETIFLPKVKEYLSHSRIYPCIINQDEYDIKLLYNLLSEEEIECDYDIFQAMISLQKIVPSKRIIWKLETVNLIRFVFIIFDIPSDEEYQLQHKPIRERISTYFMDSEKSDIKLTDKGSELSSRKKEKHSEANIEYNSLKNKIERARITT